MHLAAGISNFNLTLLSELKNDVIEIRESGYRPVCEQMPHCVHGDGALGRQTE